MHVGRVAVALPLQKGEQELWVAWSDLQVNLEGTSPKCT